MDKFDILIDTVVLLDLQFILSNYITTSILFLCRSRGLLDTLQLNKVIWMDVTFRQFGVMDRSSDSNEQIENMKKQR